MLKRVIIPIGILLLLNSCKTVDNEVQQLVYTRQAAVTDSTTTSFKNQFVANMQGTYQLLSGETLVINGNGSFSIGEVEYFVHQALSANQGVYVAATPDPNSSKKIYTYHGIINTGVALLSVPYKVPTYENGKKELTDKETPFAWQVNTFQPENINWKSGFTTVFANKTDAVRS